MSDKQQVQDVLLHPTGVASHDQYQVAFAKWVATLVIVGPTVMAALILATGGPERLLGLLPFVVVGAGAFYLLNTGRVQLAFQVLTYGVWASAVNGLFWTHGLTGTTFGVVVVALAFAGWLAGSKCAVVLTAATPPAIYLLAYLDVTGWPISIGANVTSYQRALVFSLTALGAGLFGYFGAASLRERLNRLQQAEKKYTSVFSTVPDAIVVTRRSDATYLDMNSASEKLLGYPRERLLGRTALELGTWADPSARTELLSRVDRDGKVDNFPSRFVRADGQMIDVLVSAVPYDALGEPCIIWSWSDISELRTAEREAQFRQRIESIMLDVSTRFLKVGKGEIDTIILDSLGEIGKFAEADRCFINLLDAQGQRYSLSHEWCADGIESKRAARQNVPVALAGAMWEQTARNEVMYVAVADLPPNSETRSMLERSGIKSSLAVPLVSGGQLIGCLAFDAVRQARHWPDSLVVLMRIAADILGGMIAQRRSAAAIDAAAQRLQIALEGSQISVWEADFRTNRIWLDASWAAFLGMPRAELHSNAVDMLNVVHPDDRQAAIATAVRIQRGEIASYSVEQRVRTASGEWRWILSRGRVIERDASGRPLRISGTNTDITERKQADEKLHLAASVFTHAREGIVITTPDGTIIDVNDTFSHITGYSREEVLGRNPRILASGRHGKEFYAAMWRQLIEKGHWSGEIWNRRNNGDVYAEMMTISAVRDAQGHTRQYVALFFDITSAKQHEAQLEHIAHYDALTSLPNRALLADRLHQAMAQAHRRAQRLAVAYLDLDNFKAVNDRHGHSAGDQLLVTMAGHMKQSLREGDTLSRLGGDEFVAVLLDLPDAQASAPMLARLLAAAGQVVHVGDLRLKVSASIGVTFYPQTEEVDADQLLRQADQAMYQAKLAGKNRYHVFDAEQDRTVRGHHESLERIRHALIEREFVLHYQPQVNMRTGTVIGAEALIRWQHPEKGLLPPAVFLPVIEDHPLAVEIGEWVINTALTQMTLWQASGLNIPVSVNVGARQLQQADFPERLRKIMATHPEVNAGSLELEVLETNALKDVIGVSRIIEACREIGVLFALDDFGTGYSSLTYLKRLPVSLLKIDQSFVRGMLEDQDDLAILEGVIGLASAFRRQVIAEGVETVEHGEMLLQLGCELAQGNGIARPMPASELIGWSSNWRPDSAWINCRAVSRDVLPLLFASVEHRAWIAAIEAFLAGEREVPPPLDHHQCNFGRWLDNEGGAKRGAQPLFQSIQQLHRQVHVLAAELCERGLQGPNSGALVRLGELHGLRDVLLGKMKALAQESRA